MSGILERWEEELGSKDDRRIRLRSITCERNINDIKGKEEEREQGVFTPEARTKCHKQPGNRKKKRFRIRNVRKDMAFATT